MLVWPRDEEVPYSEDVCVSAISKIVPDTTQGIEYRTRRTWAQHDPFHLLIQFQSGRSIEMDSQSVELIGVPK